MDIYERIHDRTDGDYPFYIVTGSIGPKYEPATFKNHAKALAHAKAIVRQGVRDKVWPPFAPTIEGRHDDCGCLRDGRT